MGANKVGESSRKRDGAYRSAIWPRATIAAIAGAGIVASLYAATQHGGEHKPAPAAVAPANPSPTFEQNQAAATATPETPETPAGSKLTGANKLMKKAAELVSRNSFCMDAGETQPTPNKDGVTCSYTADNGRLTSLELITKAPDGDEVTYSLERFPVQGQTYSATKAAPNASERYTEQGGEEGAVPGHYREYMKQGSDEAHDIEYDDAAAAKFAPNHEAVWNQRGDALAQAVLQHMQDVFVDPAHNW